jgi:hypothetical protein
VDLLGAAGGEGPAVAVEPGGGGGGDYGVVEAAGVVGMGVGEPGGRDRDTGVEPKFDRREKDAFARIGYTHWPVFRIDVA